MPCRLLVAIATALMPPLCTAGYGLATMQPRFIFGAFYLFCINIHLPFSDTQVVKSELDMRNHRVSVSLVGSRIPQDVIDRLEELLPRYNLETYSLHVTQNNISQADNSDAVTIALQEKTIQDLQARLDAKQAQFDSMETLLAGQIDCREISKKSRADLFKTVRLQLRRHILRKRRLCSPVRVRAGIISAGRRTYN